MSSWSDKDKPEVSAGGSRVVRYPETTRRADLRGTIVSEFQEQREAFYDLLSGEAKEVYHEVLPATPHIDVYSYPPHQNVKYWTLVTGGMSDLPMNMPHPPTFVKCKMASTNFNELKNTRPIYSGDATSLPSSIRSIFTE